jgi:hypothetical protein
MIDGLTVDDFIENNADDLWYHQNEMWECIKTEDVPDYLEGRERNPLDEDYPF